MTYSIIQKTQLEGAQRIDSEYYQPVFLRLVDRLKNTQSKRWEEIEGHFITGPFGSEFNVENYVENGKYRYIRGKDIKEFFIQENDNVYIPENDFHRLDKYALEIGDILVSVVGTIGNTSVVDSSLNPAIFSCKSTVFRTKAVNPYYFIAYLNSKYGKQLLIRCIRGHVQAGLNIDDLKSLIVFVPPTEKQDTIGNLIVESKKVLSISKNLYQQAEKMLLEELGLKDFDEENDLFSIVNFFDVQKVNRIDAEYFQPKYQRLIGIVKKQNSKRLGDLVSMTKGFEPGAEAYQENGKCFIRVSSLSQDGINEIDQKNLGDELYQKLKSNYEPKVGEILLTKDATPGIAFVLKEPIEGIVSSGILRLKIKSTINDEYLSLVINSIIGQYQSERDAGGSIISHLKPEQVKNILIPILPEQTQRKIADLVRQSHNARKKSKELLADAKKKVEEMIETPLR